MTKTIDIAVIGDVAPDLIEKLNGLLNPGHNVGLEKNLEAGKYAELYFITYQAGHSGVIGPVLNEIYTIKSQCDARIIAIVYPTHEKLLEGTDAVYANFERVCLFRYKDAIEALVKAAKNQADSKPFDNFSLERLGYKRRV